MSHSAVSPTTKNARHQRIIDLVTHQDVRSQTELAELLAQHGVHVTQATLSRDLLELDAVKVRTTEGALVYAATLVREGHLHIAVEQLGRETRAGRIVQDRHGCRRR